MPALTCRRLGILGALIVLTACGLPQPFRHDAHAPDRNPLVTLRAGIGVTVPPVRGAPLPMDRMIALDVAEALRETAEIPAMATLEPVPNAPGLRLTGRILDARVDGDRVALTLLWRLTDSHDSVLEGRVQGVAVPAEDWTHLDPAVSRRIARDGGVILARLVQGDAGAPLRSNGLALAAPDVPPMPADPGVAVSPGGDAPAPGGQARAGASPGPPSPQARPAAAAPRVIVMAPPEVTGAPGDGEQALTEALIRLFKLNDVYIQTQPGPGRFHVMGAVEVGPATDPTRERVTLLWRVLTEDGEELGRLTQENEIPAGMLDGRWGDTAYAVAEGALAGVGEILVRKGGVIP